MCAISIPLFHDLCSWRNSFKKNINNGFPVVEWLLFVMQYITVATEPLLGKTISAPNDSRLIAEETQRMTNSLFLYEALEVVWS